MPETNKPFVVTDRRKFTSDGELRPDAPAAADRDLNSPPSPSSASQTDAATSSSPVLPPQEPSAQDASGDEAGLPPAPTPEQMEQARLAYTQTAERLETAIRAADPGADHPPAMNLEQFVQSLYFTAIMQLGGGTPEDQQPRVDILAARQSIDMLAVLGEKTQGNLSAEETRLLDTALFDLRVAFLQLTQALARSAAARGPAPAAKPGIVL